MYAIKVVCKEVKGQSGSTVVHEDHVVYLVDGEWGITTYSSLLTAGADLLVWNTAEEAYKAAKKLTKNLHPWYVKAKSYEIVQIEPVYEIVGWNVKEGS